MSDFPQNWLFGQEFDPKEHMTKISLYNKEKKIKIPQDYLNVQNRLLWFIRDQRMMIASGLATTPYMIRSELVSEDLEKGYAEFKTTIRDVLGNEATMYGSETRTDFLDFQEKASTKSLGRALLLLGYGTGFATELDEGSVVDAPQESYSQTEEKSPQINPMSSCKTIEQIAKRYGLQQGSIDSFKNTYQAIKTNQQLFNILHRAGEEFAKIWVASHGFNGETVQAYMDREQLKWITLGTAIRENTDDQIAGLQEMAADLKARQQEGVPTPIRKEQVATA